MDWFEAPYFLARVRLTGQTADVADTTITGTAGTYRVTVYLVDTAADITAGAVTAHIKFNDGAAAQDVPVGPVALITLGAMAQATIAADLGSGNLTYGSTHTGLFGTAAYRLVVITEVLG